MPVGDYFLRVGARVSAQNLALTRERRPLVAAMGIAGGHFSGFHLTWKGADRWAFLFPALPFDFSSAHLRQNRAGQALREFQDLCK